MAAKKTDIEANTNLLGFLQAAFNDALKRATDPSDTTEIDYAGTRITLPAEPERMKLRKAIEVLLDKAAAEEQEYKILERIPGLPLDAAHAFVAVLKRRYGWAAATTKQTMFGPEPPQMKQVRIGHQPEDIIEVPIGQFKLHDISTKIETGFAPPSNDRKSQFMDFYIKATVDHKDRAVIMNLITETREYLQTNSIYRGKALRLTVDGGGDLDSLIEPIFVDLSKIDTYSLVLNDDVQGLLDVALTTPIRKTDSCRKHRIPLKRGILLHGPYGTGKTLCAAVTARHAVESRHGWTYVMVDDVNALAATLEFARQFQPCVVFAEDIDRIVDKDRSDEANDIINTIDGVLNKGDEVITVLTTNHIDKLPAVMLRPGRLDAIVPINLPDAKAAERLVRYYAGDLLPANANLGDLGAVLADSKFIPAAIREVVERAKLSMLMYDRKGLAQADLLNSANGLRAHAELLQEKPADASPAEAFGLAFKTLLHAQAAAKLNGSTELRSVAKDAYSARTNAEAAVDFSRDNSEKLNQIKELIARLANIGPSQPKLQAILEEVQATKKLAEDIRRAV